VEVVTSHSQGRTAAAQCGLFTHKSVPVIFEPPCKIDSRKLRTYAYGRVMIQEVGCRPLAETVWV